MKDVTGLQRQEIERLTLINNNMVKELCQQYDTIANLSNVLAHLTDDKFKQFVKDDHWSCRVCEFLEMRDDMEDST